MSTMAEVIERFLSANYPCACEGDCPGEHAEAVELADALTKAGYGKLADAWDEGWAHYRKWFTPVDPEFGINPYRSAS